VQLSPSDALTGYPYAGPGQYYFIVEFPLMQQIFVLNVDQNPAFTVSLGVVTTVVVMVLVPRVSVPLSTVVVVSVELPVVVRRRSPRCR
jgi:hypothetical protein